MSEHTPGPWVPAKNRSSPTARGVDGPNGRRIVKWGGLASPMSDEGQANARLIAAAPDLLEALKAMMRGNRERTERGFGIKVIPSDEACLMAEAAIAKAEGHD